MKNDRFRVPVDSVYLTSIGMATYCFARLEWDAVYCGEKLKPGYVATVANKTAGCIADDITKYDYLISDQNTRTRFQTAACEFKRLVKRRNDLMHANPAAVDDQQRLVRQGTPWHTTEIDDLADEFSACSVELNELYHHAL